MRYVAPALALVLLAGACSDPEPTPIERARERQRQIDAAEDAARARREAQLRKELGGDRPAPRMGLEGGDPGKVEAERRPETQTQIKRRLFATYGARLTAMQRSALQASQVGSYEEGEARCLGWIAENERFEKGTGR